MANSRLASIRRFDQLVKYLRDELDWPIQSESFEDLTFDFSTEELGIDSANAAKIQEIKRLRPLSPNQPWGIFFVKFEPKRLPVVALRRILSSVALKRRATANAGDRRAWAAEDLLFISNYGGDGEDRQITFAHFSKNPDKDDLPTLKVLGWDNLDTVLHADYVADTLRAHLRWPRNENDLKAWRNEWRQAFTVRHGEVITTSRALATRLAELARAIRNRIQSALAIESRTGPLTLLMDAFREALVHDLDSNGFADMYAQTISYGLLSARIANPKADSADALTAQMPVTNPFLKELMQAFLRVRGRPADAATTPSLDFDELGVSEVVDLLDEANMEAVVRDFGDRNPEEDPVIHFYELFLKEYDPKEKLKRGVFYTPRPVVSYIVRSVDALLVSEFGLSDGLADISTWGDLAERHNVLRVPAGVDPDQEFVQILDLATGTGTFLVEIIDLVHRRMQDKWQAQGHGDKQIEGFWNRYVAEHLLPRLHGYEILMAPYAIAHLKVGLKLRETGYCFESNERAHIYLTNSLEPPQDFAARLAFAIPALAHEAQAVNNIKRNLHYTIIVGNPPYSKASQNQGPWIEGLMETYKRTVRSEETQIQALSDDYAKFLRFGQFCLEESQAGILSLITNNSYLDGPLFRDMRSSMLSFFDGAQIVNLHGDSRKQFVTPEGAADENVFDIQQGVSIIALWRNRMDASRCVMSYTDCWGTREARYAALERNAALDQAMVQPVPSPPFFLFIPVERVREVEFQAGWHMYDIFGTGHKDSDNHRAYGAGFVTQQDAFAIGFAATDIANNVRAFLDPNVSDAALWDRFEFCTTNQWNFGRAKRELNVLEVASMTKVCLYRPFDYRYTVFDRNICTIIRRRITSQFDGENIGLLTTRRVTRLPFNNVFVTDKYAEYKVASHDRNTIVFPLWIADGDDEGTPGLIDKGQRLNLNPRFLRALGDRLRLPTSKDSGLPQGIEARDVFNYLYAVLHSPSYRDRYGEFLRIDFPRVPLTGSVELFQALADLGATLVELHLLKPASVMPSLPEYVGPANPTVDKVAYARNTIWLDRAQTAGFRGVPDLVWDFQIGGYQVCDKWLKDRGPRGGRPGRTLVADDILQYRRIVSALGQTIRLMQEIDHVINLHRGWPAAFMGQENLG